MEGDIRQWMRWLAILWLTLGCNEVPSSDRSEQARSAAKHAVTNNTTPSFCASHTYKLSAALSYLRSTPAFVENKLLLLYQGTLVARDQARPITNGWVPVVVEQQGTRNSGWLHEATLACQVQHPTQPACAFGVKRNGLLGQEITVCAGRDFVPETCPDCVRVKDGVILEPDGKPVWGVGANLPLLRDGAGDPAYFQQRGARVLRIFASGNNLHKDGPLEDWAARIEEIVEKGYQELGLRFIIVPIDYYHRLPGEPELVPDNTYHPYGSPVNFCGLGGWDRINVRPWKWYQQEPSTFHFVSNCATHPQAPGLESFTMTNAPHYVTGGYVRFVELLVSRLKDHPGVFAWTLGNELRALGRGGAGVDAIGQDQAVEVFARFAEDMIMRIRGIDRNHLILPGVQNVTEVADSVRRQKHWDATFDRMLQIPFNAWTLTWYNDNEDARADLQWFRSYGVPVIATELDWTRAPGQPCPSIDELRRRTCNRLWEGVTLAMPWDNHQQDVCNHLIFEGGWPGC